MAIVLPTLRRKIEVMHRAGAELAGHVKVIERRSESTRWDYDVLVFELFGHPEARYCYAWQSRDGRVVTVLGVPPVSSAADAVHAREITTAPRPFERRTRDTAGDSRAA